MPDSLDFKAGLINGCAAFSAVPNSSLNETLDCLTDKIAIAAS